MTCPEVTMFRNVRRAGHAIDKAKVGFNFKAKVGFNFKAKVGFNFKVSNVKKVANFYGIVLFPCVCGFLRCTLSL